MQARAALWQLNEMWNEDKHRNVLVVADPSWTSQFMISTLHRRDPYPGEVKPTNPENPSEVFRLDAASDSLVTAGRPSKLVVRFASPQIVERLQVVPTLEWMLKDISLEILPGLESFIRYHPLFRVVEARRRLQAVAHVSVGELKPS